MKPNLFVQRNAFIVSIVTAVFCLVGAYTLNISFSSLPFFIAASLFQIIVYCSPLLLLLRYGHYLPDKLTAVLSCLYSLSIITLILANYKLYSLYGFYINSFVFNIVTTPGGIEALGANTSTYLTLGIYSALGLSIYALYMYFVPSERLWALLPKKRYSIVLVIACFVFQAMSYAIANHQSEGTVLNASKAIAWYIPVTAKSLLKKLGVEGRGDDGLAGGKTGGQVNYPKFAKQSLAITKPYNIIWLVAESWRYDMLSERIMPASYKFAENNLRYMRHYSGGNGTRMGMFTQFYGLYGSYWFDILREGKSPLLIDTLIDNNYQMKAFTSAKFTYPEFDKTIFSRFSSKQLHSDSKGYGWQRDQRNTSELIKYIKNTEQPFFTFMFFESAHANYHFPKENIIETDFLENFDYLDTNISKHIGGIKNRYINSSNHLDSQLARVISTLESTKKLANSIVIITGDHGEEFMEKGRWGHNSTFSEEQIRVPLILHIPNQAAEKIQQLSSHLDLPATILSALGVDIDPALYSFGSNLLSRDFQRDFTVASDWHGNALITKNIKYVMSSKARQLGNNISTTNDQLVSKDQITTEDQKTLGEFVKQVSSFYQ